MLKIIILSVIGCFFIVAAFNAARDYRRRTASERLPIIDKRNFDTYTDEIWDGLSDGRNIQIDGNVNMGSFEVILKPQRRMSIAELLRTTGGKNVTGWGPEIEFVDIDGETWAWVKSEHVDENARRVTIDRPAMPPAAIDISSDGTITLNGLVDARTGKPIETAEELEAAGVTIERNANGTVRSLGF